MNDNEPKDFKPKRGGWNSAPDYTPSDNFWRDQLFVIILLAVGMAVIVFAARKAEAEPVASLTKITSIYWCCAE